jgi:ATP dependent DNA ligase C terminal region
LTLIRAFTPEPIRLPKNPASAAASSWQMVYDLSAKSRVGLRLNCKKSELKVRFTCNRFGPRISGGKACRRKERDGGAKGVTPAVMKRCQWVEPVLVAQVKFTEWTLDNQLRQPVFLGLRTDKEAKDVVRE